MSKQKKHTPPQKGKKVSVPNNKQLRYVLIICAAIFISAFLLYKNTLHHQYALDDDIYTKKNAYVQQGFSALKDIFNKGSLYGFNGVNDAQYRPIALLNFMAEVHFFGMHPEVSHLFNVLFYAIICVILFLFLKKILKNYHIAVPAAAALLFTFHPIHTEVVANIKSRDEILSFLFGVISFYFIARYIESKKTKHYWTSVIIFFVSTLCKETSLMFAFLAALTFYFFSDLPLKKTITLSVPYIGAIVVYYLIRKSVLSSVTFNEDLIVMNNSLQAATNLSERYATNFVMLGKYLTMLFYPHPLSWDYSYKQFPIVNWSDIGAITSLCTYLFLGAYVIVKFKKKDIYAFCILFFMLTLILTCNLVVKIGATFGERFLFAPSLAFCIAVPITLSRFIKLNPEKYIYILTGILLVGYTSITVPRNLVWENNFELFKSGVITSPNSARTHLSLAIEYRTQAENFKGSDPNERKKLFENSIKCFGDGLAIYDKDPDAFYNLGVTYYEMGDKENALKTYVKTLTCNPGYIGALNNSGVIYFERQDYDNALKKFTNVLKYNINYPDAYANIGAVYHNKSQHDLAITNYEKAISLNPKLFNVYDNLIKIYDFKGNKDKANYYSELKKKNGG